MNTYHLCFIVHSVGFGRINPRSYSFYFSYRQPKKRLYFTDFIKAFDRVDHGILLMKLFKNGVDRHLIKLLKSCLSNRYQSVRMNGEISDPNPVTSRVSQGSILQGSIVFPNVF